MHTQQNVTHTHNKGVNEYIPVNITCETQQGNMQDNIAKDSSPNQIAVDDEEKGNPNYMTTHSD